MWRIQCSTWWLRHGHLRIFLSFPRGFTGGTVVKTLPASARDAGSIPRLGRSLRRKWQLIPVFLPGKLHWQRSLTGYIRCDWAGTHAKFSVEGVCLVTQSCPTLRDPMDYSPLGSSVLGILQARMLEWMTIPFSRGSSWHRDRTWVSCIAGGSFIIWAIGVLVIKNLLVNGGDIRDLGLTPGSGRSWGGHGNPF